MHEWIQNKEAIWLFYVLMAELLVSLYSAVILTVEYFWGRSDTDLKREVTRRIAARKKYNTAPKEKANEMPTPPKVQSETPPKD